MNYPFLSLGTHPLWPDEQTIPVVNFTSDTIEIINLPRFTQLGGGGAEEGGAEEGGAEEGGAEEGGAEGGGAEEGGAEEGGAEEGGAEEGGAEEGGAQEGGAQEGGAEEGGAEEGGAEEGGAEEGGAEEGGAEEGGARAPLHPMDCTDIVIGVARGNQYRVIDYYTRDRATPRKDKFYGGQDGITGAVAKEVDGVTYVKWRKSLQSGKEMSVASSGCLVLDE